MEFITTCDDGTSAVKKKEFQEYLQRTGTTEKLTSILDNLSQLDVRPENPIMFLLAELGGKVISPAEIIEMDMQLANAEFEIKRLNTIYKTLLAKNASSRENKSVEERTKLFLH